MKRLFRALFWSLLKLVLAGPVLFVGCLVQLSDEKLGFEIIMWVMNLGDRK